MIPSRSSLILGASVLVACNGGDKSDDSGVVDVSPASWLQLDADGGLTLLRDDGTATFAFAPGLAPELRSVEEDLTASLGIWLWDRTETTASSLDFLGVSGDEDEVLLDYDLVGPDGASGTASLSVLPEDDATVFTLSVVGTEGDAIAIPVACDPNGSFHGWGEQYGATDQTGEAFTLFVSEQGIGREGESAFTGNEHTTYFPMPWYLDARGFGVLFETDYRTNVDLCATDAEVAWIEVMAGGELSWRVFDGPEPKDVIGQLGDHIGRPKAPPSWAYGTWMCMQGGEERVREQVDLLEDSGIPATVLWVQDWTGRRENPGGGYGVQYRWEADEDELYPDIADFFAELKDDGYRVVGYVNPFVDQELQHWEEMEAGGMLPLDPDSGEVYTFVGPRGSMTTADLSNPATQDYIKERLAIAVDDVGLDGWMADFAEWLPIDAQIHEGDARGFHNRYPEAWQRLTREVMDDLRPDGDWLMFARSGWTGVHSVAMIHWAGDQEADFLPTDGLPTVVPALLNMGLSGQPFVTHDIAGFSGGPSTPELYWRWTELGAFTPFMRTHDGNERDTNHRWDADEETTAHFRFFAKVHEALGPELEALAEEAEQTGVPVVRHLMLEHPEDDTTWGISDQFLLGPDLLVAPITTEGATSREVYFPEGDWFNVWDGSQVSGPGWETVDGPVGAPPVFSRGAERTDLRSVD